MRSCAVDKDGRTKGGVFGKLSARAAHGCRHTALFHSHQFFVRVSSTYLNKLHLCVTVSNNAIGKLAVLLLYNLHLQQYKNGGYVNLRSGERVETGVWYLGRTMNVTTLRQLGRCL